MPTNKCYLETLRLQSRWVAIIDLDEYLYPRDGSDDIKVVLERYKDVGALAVPWLTFGSSGLIEQPESVVNSFLVRNDYDKKGWTSFKTIARTEALAERPVDNQKSWEHFVLGIHNHRLKNGRSIRPSCEPADLELLGEPLPYCLYFNESNVSTMSLAINHYRIMSRDYYLKIKMQRPSATTPLYDISEGDMEYFNQYDNNIIRDEMLKSIR